MYHCGLRQVGGERHVAYKVDLMVWSNRLDLLALSNFKVANANKFIGSRLLETNIYQAHILRFQVFCVVKDILINWLLQELVKSNKTPSNHGRVVKVCQLNVKPEKEEVTMRISSNSVVLTFLGEVQVHRLHWQKVWTLPPPSEDVTVKAMAWRPDGRALAIGYSSGVVYVIDMEDKEELERYELEQEEDEFDQSKHGITCLSWIVRTETLESATEPNVYDDASLFLQNVPSSGEYKNQGTDENTKDFKVVPPINQLSMLLVGYGSGYVYMNVFGRYPFGTIHLAQLANDDFGGFKVFDICMSDDFSLMQVLYLDCLSNTLNITLLNTSVLSAYAEEVFIVAKKHSEIAKLVVHLDQTMVSIIEAWEHILLEMDTKMADYAASVPEGGVSADLLELLMLGTPSDELEVRLFEKLTVNDLKKFGNSIELSYSTIQKLVLKQLNIVGQSLTYYLSELRGLTRIPDRYKILGIEEADVTEAIRACCAFLNKCLELQQVIDTSMRNYKAFFRWLFVVMVRLLGEQTPSEIVKITQQELGHIAEFLYNFDNVQVESSDNLPDKPVKFNLERLGQYLDNQELTILPDEEDNPWHKFLKENSCLLKDNDTIFNLFEFKKFSLVQQQNHLKTTIGQIFDVAKKDTCKHFTFLYNISCYQAPNNSKLIDDLRICQAYHATEHRFLLAFVDAGNENEGIHFMTLDIKEKGCAINAMKYYFSSCLITDDKHSQEKVTIMDLKPYSSEYISVLTRHPQHEDCSIFIQVPIKIALENSIECIIKIKQLLFNQKIVKKDMSPLLEPSVYKVLDKMDGFRIAVSGRRKVGVVLAKSLRKVRVFEMEVDADDEEDDTLDVTPQSLNATDQSASEKHNTTSDVTF